MAELCLETVRAGREGNYPVAAGIFSSQRLIVSGSNKSFVPKVKSSVHAEMVALDSYEESGQQIQELYLLTTLEPCSMCTARIALTEVKRVVYLARDPAGGGVSNKSSYPPDFAKCLESVKFEQFHESGVLILIGELLYRIGEKMWQEVLRNR